jgi:hypothetical protein
MVSGVLAIVVPSRRVSGLAKWNGAERSGEQFRWGPVTLTMTG